MTMGIESFLQTLRLKMLLNRLNAAQPFVKSQVVKSELNGRYQGLRKPHLCQLLADSSNKQSQPKFRASSRVGKKTVNYESKTRGMANVGSIDG